jgi:transcriptional regulator with XRE-family HTH domain
MHFKLAPMPKSPGELLAQKLKAEGRGAKSKLSKKLGVFWSTVNDWTHDVGFGEANQRRVAEVLGVPLDYFSAHEASAQRERDGESAMAEFLATQLGQTATDAERRTLASAKFFDGVPSSELYAAWLLSMRGMLRRPAAAVAAENADLDEALRVKGSPLGTKK